MILKLAQLGLLDERGGCFGFRDLASARQIAKLLTDGVRLSEIIRAVSQIRKWLPDVGLANVRLHAGPHYSLEIDQPGGRTDQHGQFVLAVDRSQNNPDDLFELAQSAEEAGDIVEAERLYRILMKSDPTDASAPFNLGNMLRADGRNVEAEAALRAATRVDPTFADAWYNLSDIMDDQGRVETAIECLRTALRVAPDYGDAMFNLALLLQRTNQYAEGQVTGTAILPTIGQSEWAARARRSLKFCEMQVRLTASA
jgi:tetratricopeptide (TPR) repeat protein